MIDLIKNSVKKFNLNLTGMNVLTEAASGNYKCTPLIAAFAGANVYALGRDSKYGMYEIIKRQIKNLSRQLQIEKKIRLINSYSEIELSTIDILTNTGFLRPINKTLIEKLKSNCVIPLMYEPWEFRKTDLDLDYCNIKGIKVYGTNESDQRLMTMKYIGYTILYFLLKEKKTPFSCKILIVGSKKFNEAIESVLNSLNYFTKSFTTNNFKNPALIKDYNVLVFTEFVNDKLLLGDNSNALISKKLISKSHLIIHIAGNVDINNIKCKTYPKSPSKTNYMSYRTDFIDPIAVVDLITAGFKVGEGMILANNKNLSGLRYKLFVENNYPALAFNNKKYW